MDDQMVYHPLIVLHDIVIVIDYSILGYGEHVSHSITLYITMQGKHSPNCTEVDCKGPPTSATTSYAPYRQTCIWKSCAFGALEYSTVHTDAHQPLLHHQATLCQLFEVAVNLDPLSLKQHIISNNSKHILTFSSPYQVNSCNNWLTIDWNPQKNLHIL